MITTMSERRILDFKKRDIEMERALREGWSRCDLQWERLMSKACENWALGHKFRSKWRFRRAARMAQRSFSSEDIRLATVYANLAILSHFAGHARQSGLYKEKALRQWGNASDAIENMTIAARSRSSLFHLRMEARHRETYHSNMKHRFLKFAAEMEDTLEHIGEKSTSHHRHFSRWKGERPNVYDDTRKILGASLLLIET